MARKKIFRYENSSGEDFYVPFTTKEEKDAAYLKMFKYYNSSQRMHTLDEYVDIELKFSKEYEKAKKGHVPSIKKLLKELWTNGCIRVKRPLYKVQSPGYNVSVKENF